MEIIRFESITFEPSSSKTHRQFTDAVCRGLFKVLTVFTKLIVVIFLREKLRRFCPANLNSSQIFGKTRKMFFLRIITF